MNPPVLASPVTQPAHGFEPFSTLHAVVIIVWALMTAACVVWARRLRARDRRDDGSRTRSFCNVMGLLAAALYTGATTYWFLPGVFNFDNSLPIHVCDLIALVLPFALLLRTRLTFALLWFVGVGLSSQGLITPVVRAGPATGEFWSFWISHCVVVGGGFFLVLGLGYRPRWGDYGIAVLCLAWYAFVMLLLNTVTGWNYGYVGAAAPDQPTLIDALGTWPLRLIPLSMLAAFAMALLMLPFVGPWSVAAGRPVLPREVVGPGNER